MPLVFNGVTIPENVANAFSFNGANITDVYFNGVQVWHQSLCKVCSGWSGNSVVTYYGSAGINVSGLSCRATQSFIGPAVYGSWLVMDGSTGTWTSGTSIATSSDGEGTYTYELTTISNAIRAFNKAWCYYNPSTETFTGGDSIVSFGGSCLHTSGGLIFSGYHNSSHYYGAYISLT